MMTLEEAAARLIAIVGDHSAGPPPAAVHIPWHAWENFVAAATPAPTPVEGSEELTPPEENENGESEPDPGATTGRTRGHGRTHGGKSRRG